MPRRIIGIAGGIRSGKTTAAKYLEVRYKAHSFRNSAVLGDILQRLNAEPSRRNYARLGEALFSSFDYTVLARAHVVDIQKSVPDDELSVIDGLRFPEEAEIYAQKGDWALIFLCSPDITRFGRALLSEELEKRDDRSLSLDAFQAIESTTSERRLSELAAIAHATIENDGAIHDLYRKLDRLLKGWGIRPAT